MKVNWKKGFATFLTILMLVQMLPTSLIAAFADDQISFNYHTVIFMNYDGAQLAKQFVEDGKVAFPPQKPMREATPAEETAGIAWEFAGWASEPAGTDVTQDPITKDVTFRAQYKELRMAAVTVNYTTDTNDSSVVLPPSEIKYFKVGETANVSVPGAAVPGYLPKPDPATFNGVIGLNNPAQTILVTYEKQDDLKYSVRHWFEKDDAVANNVEPTQGSVHFEQDTSLEDKNLTVPYAGTISVTDKAKPGYTMITPVLQPQTTDEYVYDIYYKKNVYTLTYDSNAGGASVPAPVLVKFNNKIVIPTKPTRTGYNFAAWVPNDDGTGTAYTADSRMPANDLTIYGTWTGTTASYKIVHWVERPNLPIDPQTNVPRDPVPGNMDDYIYLSETTGLTGIADTTVAQSVIDTKKLADPVITGTSKKYAYYQSYDKTTTIAGDGTTVINVYYQRYVYTYVFSPTSGSIVGTFPGMAAGAPKTYKFKYEQDILNFAKRESSWPYTDSDNEPKYDNNYKLVNWNFPTGSSAYPINRREVLAADLVPATPTTQVNIAPGSVQKTSYMSSFDLYYFEQLPGQTTTGSQTGANGNANYRDTTMTRTPRTDRVVIAENYVEGQSYSRLVFGNTGHDKDLPLTLGCTVITCNHYVAADNGTAQFGKTFNGVEIHEVYMKRNRVNFAFDKNTTYTPSVPLVTTMSSMPYGLEYTTWASYNTASAKTYNELQNWKPNTSPTYTDGSGVKFVFTGWNEFPVGSSPVTIGPGTIVPPLDSGRTYTVYAHWKPMEVTVTFRVDNVTVGTKSLPAYSLLSDANQPNPTKTGYTFDGWYYNGVRYANTFQLKSDLTLTAKFTPKATSYTVRWVDESNVDIRTAQTVTGKVVDNVINIPAHAAPQTIAGYTLISTTPSTGSLTLVENPASNVIIFKYQKFAGYKYNVYYKIEGTGAELFPPALNQETWAAQQVVWAKKDPQQAYYPIDGAGNLQDSQTEFMIEGQTVNITFTYRAYSEVTYTEKSILLNGTGGVVATKVDRTFKARIGQTVSHSDTTALYTEAGENYSYDALVTGTLQNATIKSANDSITLIRYYSIYRVVNFAAGANGTLVAGVPTTQKVPIRTSWTTGITVPTPKANDGYYFSGWSTTPFPAMVTAATATYTANFLAKTPITIKSNGLEVTYDGTAKSVSGFKVFNASNQEMTNLVVTGITTSNPSATDAGTYTNTIGNRAAILIMDGTTDVTERYTVTYVEQDLKINKRPLTVSGATETKEYTGTWIEGDYTPKTVAATGHTVTATPVNVSGGMSGGIATNTYDIYVKDVKVYQGNTEVTINYDITPGKGVLTIGDRKTKLDITIKAPSDSKPFTGTEESTTLTQADTGKPVTITGTMPTGGTLTYTAFGKGVATGTYDITFTAGPQIFVQGVNVTAQYNIDKKPGTLTIEDATDKIAITIKVPDVTKPYTGDTVKAELTTATNAVIVSGTLPAGGRVEYTAYGDGIVTGTHAINFTSGPEIWVGTTNVTKQYAITAQPGTLTITPLTGPNRINISVLADSAQVPYTGYPQTITRSGAVTVNADKIPAAATTTIVSQGSGTTPGSNYNMDIVLAQFKIEMLGVDLTGNYNVTPLQGKLTIQELGHKDDPKYPGSDEKIDVYVQVPSTHKDYTGVLVSFPVTGTKDHVTKVEQRINGAVANTALPTTVALAYTAKGEGIVPGTYDVLHNSDFKLTLGGVDVTANYNIIPTKGILTIDPVNGTIKITVTAGSRAIPYTGLEQNITDLGGKVTSGANLIPAVATTTITSSAKGTVPGNYDSTVNTVSIMNGAQDLTGNYQITPAKGTLTIQELGHKDDPKYPGSDEKIKVTAKVPDDSAEFTGALITVNKTGGNANVTAVTQTIDGTKVYDGNTLRGTVTLAFTGTGSGTLIGHYDILGNTGWTLTQEGADVTKNFDVSLTKGDFEITKVLVPITVQPNELAVDFTGHEIVYTETLPGHIVGTVAGNVTITMKASTSGYFAPGTYNEAILANKTTKVFVDGVDVTENYKITELPGKLTINKVDGDKRIPLTVKADDDTQWYTGATLDAAVGPVVTRGNGAGELDADARFTVTATGRASGIEPKTYPIVIPATGTEAVKVFFGTQEITSNYNLTVNEGVFTIKELGDPGHPKIKITVTPNDVTEKFTGHLISVTNGKGTISALTPQPAGVTMDMSASGSGFSPNVTPNEYPIKANKTTKIYVNNGATDVTGNYDITEENGYLTIKPVSGNDRIKLTVTAKDAEDWYTGKLLTVSVDVTYPTGATGNTLDSQFTLTAKGKSQGVVPGNYDIVIPALTSGDADTVVIKDGAKVITDNYDITLVKGKFTINKLGTPDHPLIPLTVTANNASETFTGSPITVTPGGKITSGTLEADHEITVYSEGTGNLPGPYDILVDLAKTYIQYKGNGVPDGMTTPVDVTNNYIITPAKGTLTITKSAFPITITVNSVNHDFISSALRAKHPATTETGVTIVPLGGVGGTVSSSTPLPAGYTLTEVRAESAVVYVPKAGGYPIVYSGATIMYNDGVNPPVDATDNFSITPVNGTFTVNPLDGNKKIKVDIEVAKVIRAFTGAQINITTQDAPPYTNTPAIDGTIFRMEANTSGSGFVPGVYTNGIQITDGKIWYYESGVKKEDVTSNYNIVYHPADLEITELSGNDRFAMTVTPTKVEKDYTGALLTAEPTTGTITGVTLGANLALDMYAYGEGTAPGDYKTVFDDPTHPGHAKIMYTGLLPDGNTGTVDVSANYNITKSEGDFKINVVKIALTVKPFVPSNDHPPAPPQPLIYNGNLQGYANFDVQEYTIDPLFSLPTGVKITVNKDVHEKNAGTYPINYTASDVIVEIPNGSGGWINITENYTITCLPETVTIQKFKVTGEIKADEPKVGGNSGPFEYGTDVPVPAGINNLDPLPANGDPLDAPLSWTVVRDDPNNNDVGVSHTFTPVWVVDNPNYDVSAVVRTSSDFTYYKTKLIVQAGETSMPYSTTVKEPADYPYTTTGLKWGDTDASIGLRAALNFSNSYTLGGAIGQNAYDIGLTAGTLTNYDLEVHGLPNGLSVYGQIEYHGNYLDGVDIVVYDGEFYDSTAPAAAKHPNSVGLYREGFKYLEWTYDAAGTNVYDESDPITPYGIVLYGQWVEVFRLTVYHKLEDGTEIAPAEVKWLEHGELYKFLPLDNLMYDPQNVQYTADGVLFTQSPWSYMRMPRHHVDATITYIQLSAAEIAARIERLRSGQEEGWGYYTIPDDDIPLSGIGGKNMGDCFE